MNTTSNGEAAADGVYDDADGEADAQPAGPAGDEDQSAARDQAASKIQAIQRGRAVRKNMNTTSNGEAAADGVYDDGDGEDDDQSAARDQAASKIQAVQRGRAVRKNMNTTSNGEAAADGVYDDGDGEADAQSAEPAGDDDQSAARDQAASKIQAVQRGRAVRKNMNTTSNGEVAADSFTVFAVEKSADVATHHVDSAPRAVASRSAAQQDGRSVKSSKVPTSRERSKVIPVQEKTEVKRSQSGSPEREPKHKTERSKAREWDFDTTIEVPVDPLSMETLARRPQQADEVHKGPLRSLNPHEPLPWDRLYQQAQVAQAKNEISKAEEKPTRSPEDHEIFRLRNEVHLLRREVAWLQQGESRTQSNGSKVVEKPMRFGLAPKVVREKDKEVCEKATEKAVEKGPTPTKAEILATLRIERERLKMEAQHLRSRSGPAASSPSKKSGGRSTEAKDPISSEKETEQVPESVTDPDPQKDSKLKASTCRMFAKKMARSVTPTRPSRKVESPNKLLKERDASRSVTPSRSAVKKVDAAVKQSSPTRNGAASRSVSPTRLKQDKTVSSKVELPIKRRTPSPSLKDMVAKKMKEGRSGTPVHQAFSKAIAKANEAKKRQLDTLGKQSAEKGRTKSPTRQRSVSPVVTSAQKRSLSPKTTQVSPRTGKPLEATQGTRKVAVQPQIFDRLHQDHAKRMWILEERQALAEETEQKNAKALQG